MCLDCFLRALLCLLFTKYFLSEIENIKFLRNILIFLKNKKLFIFLYCYYRRFIGFIAHFFGVNIAKRNRHTEALLSLSLSLSFSQHLLTLLSHHNHHRIAVQQQQQRGAATRARAETLLFIYLSARV